MLGMSSVPEHATHGALKRLPNEGLVAGRHQVSKVAIIFPIASLLDGDDSVLIGAFITAIRAIKKRIAHSVNSDPPCPLANHQAIMVA